MDKKLRLQSEKYDQVVRDLEAKLLAKDEELRVCQEHSGELCREIDEKQEALEQAQGKHEQEVLELQRRAAKSQKELETKIHAQDNLLQLEANKNMEWELKERLDMEQWFKRYNTTEVELEETR